jgi:hypothetical protein
LIPEEVVREWLKPPVWSQYCPGSRLSAFRKGARFHGRGVRDWNALWYFWADEYGPDTAEVAPMLPRAKALS